MIIYEGWMQDWDCTEDWGYQYATYSPPYQTVIPGKMVLKGTLILNLELDQQYQIVNKLKEASMKPKRWRVTLEEVEVDD